VTGKNLAEVPNMSQRTVMQCLSLDDWKVVAHLPVPVGELMVSRLLEYGWIESQSEEQRKAIRLTPDGLKALRSRAV
jgi:predicted solute-binding protein